MSKPIFVQNHPCTLLPTQDSHAFPYSIAFSMHDKAPTGMPPHVPSWLLPQPPYTTPWPPYFSGNSACKKTTDETSLERSF